MGGGGSSTTTTSNPQLDETTKWLRGNVMEPLGKIIVPMMQGLMKTGKVGTGLTPTVQQGVSGVRSNTSSAWENIKNQLMRAGQLFTPFGQGAQASTIAGGEEAAAGVEPNLAKQIFQTIPGMVTGASNVVLQGQQGAGTGTTTTSPAPGATISSLLGQLAGLAMMSKMMPSNSPSPTPTNLTDFTMGGSFAPIPFLPGFGG